MIDIHHHLLWGVDDGAKDFDTAVAMAKASSANGVTHIVCTPHANSRYLYSPEVNQAKAEQLQSRLDADNVPIRIGMGCDFHMSYDNIQDAKTDPSRFSINGLGYLMVEIPDYGVPAGMTEIFYELQLAGLTPILTHPERNPTLQTDHTRLGEWMRGGVLVQITGDSVTGKMGKKAEKLAHVLLAKRWVHFVATDAHGVGSRPPRLSEAREWIAKKHGQDYAESLVTANPQAVFDGKTFEPTDEPIGLYQEFKDKSWWQHLFQ